MQILELVRINPDITGKQILILQYIMENEGTTVNEIMKRFDFTQTVATRATRTLGEFGYGSKDPLFLIEHKINPEDKRSKYLYLSDSGKKIFERFNKK